MKSLYSTLTKQETTELLKDIMEQYEGLLDDQDIQYEVMVKFYDINDEKYTFSGMTRMEAYQFNSDLQGIYNNFVITDYIITEIV